MPYILFYEEKLLYIGALIDLYHKKQFVHLLKITYDDKEK